MDKECLSNIIYDCKKDLVYIVNREIYVKIEGELLVYSTFFARVQISATLNVTAKIIFLLIDGKRTVKKIYEECLNIFTGVSKDKLLSDLLATLNRFEHEGIIKSTIELKREMELQKHSRKTLDLNLFKIRSSLGLVE